MITQQDALRSAVITQSVHVPINVLYQDRARYQNFPPFQREKVWGRAMRQAFIDSLLRRLPIASIMLMEDTDGQGKSICQIIDGQQRYSTMIDYVNNSFATMHEGDAKGGLFSFGPIEVGKKFSELSQEMQDRFLNYSVPLIIFAKSDEIIMEEIYLRVNRQSPLSVGEQLFIHNSRAKQMALKLLEHTFWQNRYTGRGGRKDSYQAALHLIAIEAFGFPLNLTLSHTQETPLTKLVSGGVDSELTDTMLSLIWARLTAIEHMFVGADIHSKRDIVPVYEAVSYLDDQGFSLTTSQSGCLTHWFILSKRGQLIERVKQYYPFARMDFFTVQRDFWAAEAENLKQLPGLVRKTETETVALVPWQSSPGPWTLPPQGEIKEGNLI